MVAAWMGWWCRRGGKIELWQEVVVELPWRQIWRTWNRNKHRFPLCRPHQKSHGPCTWKTKQHMAVLLCVVHGVANGQETTLTQWSTEQLSGQLRRVTWRSPFVEAGPRCDVEKCQPQHVAPVTAMQCSAEALHSFYIAASSIGTGATVMISPSIVHSHRCFHTSHSNWYQYRADVLWK